MTGQADRQYLLTERAHYMCPNMHFGIMAKIDASLGIDKVRTSLKCLSDAHPFLRSVIAREDNSGKLFYDIMDHLAIPLYVKSNTSTWKQDYDKVSSEGWDVHAECLLKVLLYPENNSFRILFVAHHLLCDGKGLLELVEEFTEHYIKGTVPSLAPEHLISGPDDLPPKSGLPMVSKVIVNDANKKFRKEGRNVLYPEYREFEKDFISKHRYTREIEKVRSSKYQEIITLCKQNKISVNDYLIADMMLKDDTDKVIIAEDIRNKVKGYKCGSMGNYATAFSVVVKKKKMGVTALAKLVSAEVKKILSSPQKEMLVLSCYMTMDPELLDAVAIATLGGFESNAASFVGTNMFGFKSMNGYCITNLGKIESEFISEAAFIPPASPANRKAQGVLTVNDKMSICTVTAE